MTKLQARDETLAGDAHVTGVITRLFPDKGFGFIKDADGQEYFVHRSNCEPGVFETLRSGAKLTFGAVQTDKGWRAVGVTTAEK